MKMLLVAGFLMVGLLSLKAEELILNEDFSDGEANWEGDGRAASGPDAVNLGVSNGSGGLLVQLNPTAWTKVSQRFEAHTPTLTMRVIYTVAPGTKFFKLKGNHFDISSKVGFIKTKPVQFPNRNWAVMIFDVAGRKMDWFKVAPNFNSPEPQFVAGQVTGLVAHEDEAICLAFPPGQGSITLQRVMVSE